MMANLYMIIRNVTGNMIGSPLTFLLLLVVLICTIGYVDVKRLRRVEQHPERIIDKKRWIPFPLQAGCVVACTVVVHFVILTTM